jgi:hypothetical protein
VTETGQVTGGSGVPPEPRHLTVHKRPSRGRGEYELVGRDRDTTAAQLVGRVLLLQTRHGVRATNLAVGHQGGKNRLRMIDRHDLPHLQRQMSALALLPESTRDETRVSDALPVLLHKRYILDIEVDVAALTPTTATLRPTALIARSGDLSNRAAMQRLDLDARLQDLERLYAASDRLPASVRTLVDQHARIVHSPDGLGSPLERVVRDLIASLESQDAYYLPGSDPLPTLLLLAGLSSDEPDVPEPPATPADELEVRLRSEHIYRMRRMRGASASAFRASVQQAYNYRCAFCGLRAPKVAGLLQSGVDAAHILPWGTYDLDVTPNGVMLCKQHHWAFDNRVLRLDHASGQYFVSVSPRGAEIFAEDERTLALLTAVSGRIPDDRLPAKSANRPRAQFIDEFNALDAAAT